LTTAREIAERYKYPSFLMETAFEHKYQMAMETAERNTSTRWQWKLQSGIQVIKLAQRKLHSEMCTSTQEKNFFFFFLNQRNFEENRVKGME